MKIQSQFQVADDLQIVTVRTVDLSREAVFQAFSNPENLRRWWGPKDSTNTFEQFEFRVGGRWKFMMHGPDGGNYLNECEFIQIDEPKLIAWNHLSEPPFTVVFEFEAVGSETTRVVFRMLFGTKQDRDTKLAFVAEKNEENMDRLEAVLATNADKK